MSEKMLVFPEMSACLDDKGKNYLIEIEMPGVDKKDIQLSMHEGFIQVTAEKNDASYRGHLHFPLKVDPKKAKATYENGLLKVEVPLMEKLTPPVKVEIQ